MKKSILALLLPVILLGFGCSDDAIPAGHYRVTTIATPGGKPDVVAIAGSGNIYITDIEGGQVLHIAGNGTATQVGTLGATAHPDGITAVSNGTTDIISTSPRPARPIPKAALFPPTVLLSKSPLTPREQHLRQPQPLSTAPYCKAPPALPPTAAAICMLPTSSLAKCM
jgi:hypothetical protein